MKNKKRKKIFWRKGKREFMLASLFFLLVMPSSTDYKLKDYGFGTGGTGNSTSSNYGLEAISGEISESQLSGSSYGLGPGLIFTNQANVPKAPVFDNPANYYNKLRLIIDPSGNPSDTKFAVAISLDNFVTTKYVQSDDTIGDTLGTEDYRTYSSWGGASGTTIIGLLPNTEYKVKIKAMQGRFTETGYGPVATASTSNPTLLFDIDVSEIDQDTDPPFSIKLPDLLAGTVISSAEKIWVDLVTNGESGGRVYVSGLNEGLLSNATGYRINAVSDNLGALQEGFGAQGSSAAGGLTIASPYNQTGDVVGITDNLLREIFTATSPLSSGRGAFILKAKSSAVTPSAGDYGEILTVVAVGNF